MIRHFCRQLLQPTAGAVGKQIIISSSTSGATAATSSSSLQTLRETFLASAAPRRLFSSTPSARDSKSMLGATGLGHASSIMEGAAEAQMHKIKSKMDATDVNQPVSPLRRVIRLLADTIALGAVGTGLASAYYYFRYDLKDLQTIVEESKKAENEFFGSQLWVPAMEKYLDVRTQLETKVKEFTDPTYHKLLPDMAPELRGRIKTLVLDLNDVLVHKEWSRQKGWTLYKRPGAQDFIAEMGQYFELVVFTDEPNTYADPIINRLDSLKLIPYRLYRAETQYHSGKHVRDLSKLNRDLSQVLFVSADPDAYSFQPENAIKLKRWCGSDAGAEKDTTLLDLIPMLQLIATRGVKDVRDVVKSYDGEEDVAKAFKSRMQHVAESHKAPAKRGFLSIAK